MSSSNSVEGSHSKRCAACKHLRRRCAEDCVLARYFPATHPERFECVHKIFGAGNVAKMLKTLPVQERAQAAESLSTEAYWRVQDPVYGSAGIVMQKQKEICATRCELAKTLAQISMHEAHEATEQQPLPQHQASLATQPTQENMYMFEPNDPFHFPN